jgi:hypothetical protein
MLYAPFNPWEFDPAQAFATATAYGGQLMNGSNGQGGTLGQSFAGNSPQLQQAVSNVTNAMSQYADASPMAAQEQMYGPGSSKNRGNPLEDQQQSLEHPNSAQPSPQIPSFTGDSGNPPEVPLPPSAGPNQQVQSPPASGDTPPLASTGGGGPLAAATPDALKLVSNITGNQAMPMSQPTPELTPPPGASPSAPLAMVNPNAPLIDVFNASAGMTAPGLPGPPPVSSPSPPTMPEPLMTV